MFSSTSLFAQKNLKGRIYEREGLPLSWFKLETDSGGYYYSKPDVADLHLSKNSLYWKYTTDSTIKIRFNFLDIGDTTFLYYDKVRDLLVSNDLLEVYRRKSLIFFNGVTYKE